MKNFKEFFVENVVNLQDHKKKKATNEFKAKLDHVASKIPDAFANQEHIENEVKKGVENIKKEGRLKFALPHIQSQYVKSIHSIEALHFHMPLLNHKGESVFDDYDDKTVQDHVKRNKKAILGHIEDKISKFKKLNDTASKAPAPQYARTHINYAVHHWQTMHDNFSKVKE